MTSEPARPMFVARDGELIGLVGSPTRSSRHPLRPSVVSSEAGLDVWMITGDRRATADAIGAQVGIGPDRILAEVLPADKAAKIAGAPGGRRGRRDGRRRHQ